MALRRYSDYVLVQERAPGKSLRYIGAPGEPWKKLEFAVMALSPSAVGPLCLTTSDGAAYFWEPDDTPQKVWEPDAPGDYTITAIGGDNLLVRQFDKNGIPHIQAVNARDRHQLWRLEESPLFLEAVPSGLLFLSRDEPMLECLDATTGALRWSCGWSGGVLRIGMVDEVLWAPGDSELLRVDCASGRVLPPVAVQDTESPGGILDDRGIFHCCRGLNYQTFDLQDGGRQLSFAEFRITTEGPTLGAGPAGMIITTDGRLIFSDQRHGVWVVHPEQPTQPELTFRASSMIVGLAAWQGQVLVAESANTITALGVS
jgi:hypothetical protein